jgi:membrane peptidoglycan carboxypeptidase
MPGVTGRTHKSGSYRNRVALGVVLMSVLLLIAGLGVFVASAAAGVAGTLTAYREVNAGLTPDAGIITAKTFENTRIYDRNHNLLQEVANPNTGWRTFKPLNEISPYVVEATVSAEDSTFWSHYGVEPLAIVRGALIIFNGEGSSGGSTITQQVVRGLYPEKIGTDYSLTRKIKEAMAAVAVDNEYSKQDIMTMYLNQIFYGQRSFGIEAAAQTYFQKHAKDLDLAEASLLAGLPQAPSYYDPTVRFDQAKLRQRYVLDQMVKYKYITKEEADNAFNEPLKPGTRTGAILHAPHFTNYVKDYISDKYGEDALYEGGLQITTSIDINLQDKAEQILANQVAQLAPYNRNNAAMVMMVPWSGEILAMVGSANFDDPTIGGQINYAVAPLQPGSSIKPVVYAKAFEDGWNPGTIIFDDTFREPAPPGSGQPDYEPQNYTGQSFGAVTVRTALANSLNIPAVKAIQYVGVDQAMDMGRRMGLKKSFAGTAADHGWGLSLALGAGEVSMVEHTNVYATLANEGKYVPANPILKITDSQGHVLYDITKDPKVLHPTLALRAAYAYQITSILTDNQARSMIFTENNLFGNTQDALGRPTAAKSGTTDGWKDIWTMGYTTDLAIGVWVGQTTADGSRQPYLPELDGIVGAGPIWSQMMIEMHQNPTWSKYLVGPNGNQLPESFPVPPDIVKGPVCVATGGQPTGGDQTRQEVLVRGGGPALKCNELSAYQAKQLAAALADVRTNGGKYTGNGVDSIYRFADEVGASSGGRARITPSDDGGPDDAGDSEDSSPIIESQDG